ncbi:hypothetical protein L3X38_013360 [Prunus dulcis]|uniref:Uncharacterized protein n=1 Tax=Prunus dulcis TaxID=3755 RepID=A0AAD4WL30_PRUDU|nr:hypothetical protein L3X38_013360 [Prunus dulcis]
MPHLSDSQYHQIMSVMAKTSSSSPSSPQAYAASASSFSQGLDFEDDDWCCPDTPTPPYTTGPSLPLLPFIGPDLFPLTYDPSPSSPSATCPSPGLDLLNQPALYLPIPTNPTPFASIQAPLPADVPPT